MLSISFPGGVRNQVISERFLTFLITEIAWILYTIVLRPLSAQLPKTPYPRRSTTPTYLRRAVPSVNGACAGEMASPFYMKAITAVAAPPPLLLLVCAAATPAAAIQKQQQQ